MIKKILRKLGCADTEVCGFLALYRFLFKKCIDCGVKLPKNFNRGDVCSKCFDDFDGLTMEELCSI